MNALPDSTVPELWPVELQRYLPVLRSWVLAQPGSPARPLNRLNPTLADLLLRWATLKKGRNPATPPTPDDMVRFLLNPVPFEPTILAKRKRESLERRTSNSAHKSRSLSGRRKKETKKRKSAVA